MERKLRLVDDPLREADNRTGGGNGTRIEDRLRRLEDAVVRIEAYMEHMASREWIYKAILTGLGLAAGITVALTRLFP